MYKRQDSDGDDEDDDEKEVNPKLEKIMTIGGIVAAVIIALIVLFLVGKMVGIFSFGSVSYTHLNLYISNHRSYLISVGVIQSKIHLCQILQSPQYVRYDRRRCGRQDITRGGYL